MVSLGTHRGQGDEGETESKEGICEKSRSRRMGGRHAQASGSLKANCGDATCVVFDFHVSYTPFFLLANKHCLHSTTKVPPDEVSVP